MKLQDWNFRAQRINNELGKTGGEFVSSESTIILISPIAQLTEETIAQAKAMALTQDVGFSQQPQAMQVFEIGSRYKYTIRSGRVQAQINLSRMIFDGETLLANFAPERAGDFPPRDHPGYGNFVINMASSVFQRPVGLGFIFRDLQNQNIGGFFCEETFVNGSQMQMSANQSFVSENVSLIFNSLIPLDI